MKFYSLLLTFLLFGSTLLAQNSFCKGWEEGYEAGKQSLNERMFITPICPNTLRMNNDSYDNGYAAGFEKATGQKVAALATPNSSKAGFCEGWEQGYTNAMKAANRAAFITPICPIAPINEDNYDAGYLKGYQKAQAKLGQNNTNFIPTNAQGDYCDGWERGYQTGLQLWAEQNNKRKPLKITPICPIAPINQDSYTNAFVRGQKRAFKDMD